MRVLKILLVLVVIGLVGAGGFFWWSSYPSIPAIDTPPRTNFTAADIALGEKLVAVGDCAVCHTKPGGGAFAGGLPLPTPFGTIYSTNITPDRDTGIGAWSEAAFRRAMHEGIERGGRYLYPAFPFDHFTGITDTDVHAIYAFLMTRPAVREPAAANELRFPFNIRPLLAGWHLLFFKPGRFAPDSSKSAEWNRGAYLAEGLGHCGACHTPRNRFGAEESNARLAGGEAEGWHAPALAGSSRAPIPWTRDAMVNFLIDGWDADHGVAAGPMAPVVNQLATLEESDVTAIATYVVGLAGGPPAGKAEAAKAFAAERELTGPTDPGAGSGPGAATFARVCATCHKRGGQTVPLGLSTAVNNPGPGNVIQVMLSGIKPPEGSPDRSMPAFAGSLKDADIADVAAYLRSRFSKEPAWTDIEAEVRAARATMPHQGG
jgi:mono/diheme cytochrome c family protein